MVRKVFCARYIGGSVEATKEQQRDTRVKAFKRCVERAQIRHLIAAYVDEDRTLVWPVDEGQ